LLCCAFDLDVLLPLLAILTYLDAGQSYSWLVANIVANLAAINLAADRSISLCCLDLAVQMLADLILLIFLLAILVPGC
jgi:hypothetical protein